MNWPKRDDEHIRHKDFQGWNDGLFDTMAPLTQDEWENSKCVYMGLVRHETNETRVTLFGGN
jgi:hypothetical protein